MKQAAVALGTNLGARAENLVAAIHALAALPSTTVLKMSGVYETKPVGYADQPDFLNMVVLLETALSPRALLGGCLGIEAALGRRRTFRNAPRVIDLDLVWMEGETSNDPELILPHPRMQERAFVIAPLREVLGENAPAFVGNMSDFTEILRLSDDFLTL